MSLGCSMFMHRPIHDGVFAYVVLGKKYKKLIRILLAHQTSSGTILGRLVSSNYHFVQSCCEVHDDCYDQNHWTDDLNLDVKKQSLKITFVLIFRSQTFSN